MAMMSVFSLSLSLSLLRYLPDDGLIQYFGPVLLWVVGSSEGANFERNGSRHERCAGRSNARQFT